MTLIEALKAAGAKSPDMHKIARTDVPPEQAVIELQRRYPDAFTTSAPPDADDWINQDLRKLSAEALQQWERRYIAELREDDERRKIADHHASLGINPETKS